ncbi:uncharacterized protein METZ01_LOCUS1372 [marine metagenome]|uniref:Uncharacterized protein n=1 Tax=marine metagenome TaxID=408172 RepID=A0A381N4E3_9ZZZZ
MGHRPEYHCQRPERERARQRERLTGGGDYVLSLADEQ